MALAFISYNRRSLDAVRVLAEDLAEAGHEVWFDQVLSGGQEWWDEILANIRRCDGFIPVLTPESLESRACRQELSYAMALGKTVVPVLLSDKVGSDRLPKELRTLQFVNCQTLDKRSILNLVKAVNRVPLDRQLPRPMPAPPPVPSIAPSTADRTIEMSELSQQLPATLVRVLDYQDTWVLVADSKNILRLDFPPSSTPAVRATAVFRDNSDKAKLRELQDLGWSTSSRGFRKAAGGIALATLAYGTSGVGGALLLSRRVRDYFMMATATKSWPTTTVRSELPGIADELTLALRAISPRARSAVLRIEGETTGIGSIRRWLAP